MGAGALAVSDLVLGVLFALALFAIFGPIRLRKSTYRPAPTLREPGAIVWLGPGDVINFGGYVKQIQLGETARDTISGFEGVVIADTKWLHGCRRLTLQPRALKDGQPIAAATFDEPQLELVEAKTEPGTDKTGGPRDEPARVADPRR